MTPLVRAYSVEDRMAVREVVQGLPGFFDPRVADYIEHDAGSHHAAVCLTPDGSVNGFVVWIETSVEAEIVWVGVRGDTQRRGAGTALVEYVLSTLDPEKLVIAKVGKLRENGTHLESVYNDLMKAETFWKSRRFEPIGLLKSFWGQGNDALVMRYTKGVGDEQELSGT